MIDQHAFLRYLIRKVAAQTCDHPMVARAVDFGLQTFEMLSVKTERELVHDAHSLADSIEDFVAAKGQPLSDYINEDALKQWRQTVVKIMRQAYDSPKTKAVATQ